MIIAYLLVTMVTCIVLRHAVTKNVFKLVIGQSQVVATISFSNI